MPGAPGKHADLLNVRCRVDDFEPDETHRLVRMGHRDQ